MVTTAVASMESGPKLGETSYSPGRNCMKPTALRINGTASSARRYPTSQALNAITPSSPSTIRSSVSGPPPIVRWIAISRRRCSRESKSPYNRTETERTIIGIITM